MRHLIPNTIPAAAALLAAALPAAAQEAAPPAQPTEEQLIAVVQSQQGREQRAAACRQLARVGTAKAVPALAALLADEDLSHMARYALEPIQDPAVDAALREALGRLQGRPLIGVIASLGVRRDAEAVPALAKLLQHIDPLAAQTAGRTLGRIGTQEAAETLTGALADAAADRRPAIADGLLACAEHRLAQDDRAAAAKLYALVAKTDLPKQFRVAAMQGTLQTQSGTAKP